MCSSWRRESAAALHHNHQACFKYSALPPTHYQHIDSACAVCHVSCHHLSSYHFVFCSCVCLNHSPSSTRLLLQCSLTSRSLDPILPMIHTISFPAASMLPLQSFPSIHPNMTSLTNLHLCFSNYIINAGCVFLFLKGDDTTIFGQTLAFSFPS